ncbi:MAG: hypothetical protein U9N30_02975 [Campylobacterota bacterium]|nr:hypothetical protein [Campylobacterota bacterium]
MKTVYLRIILGLILCSNFLWASSKRYEVQSAIVHYTSSSQGEVFGMKTTSTGKSILTLKEWGAVETMEETLSQSSMGQTDTTHTLTKIDHDSVYLVDFDDKTITKVSNPMMKKETAQSGKEMLESIGAKKIAQEEILGYPCEVWEGMGSKMWFYKGIMLKSEALSMGINYTMIATDIQINISIEDEQFDLPNFPIQEGMKSQHDDIPQEQMPSAQELQKMMQNLGDMFSK